MYNLIDIFPINHIHYSFCNVLCILQGEKLDSYVTFLVTCQKLRIAFWIYQQCHVSWGQTLVPVLGGPPALYPAAAALCDCPGAEKDTAPLVQWAAALLSSFSCFQVEDQGPRSIGCQRCFSPCPSRTHSDT